MSSIQYTIRNIPKPVDEALRTMAAEKRQSFNRTVLDALEKATGTSAEPVHYDDLDWFIGTAKLCGDGFDQAAEWLDDLPRELER